MMRMIGRKGQQEEKVDNLFWDKLRFSLVQSFEVLILLKAILKTL